MNVLFTSAGRRSYLLEYFLDAIGDDGIVVAANSIPDTPAMKVADRSYVLPYVYESNYLESLLEICKKEKIDYLFSLHDLEGPVLARNIDAIKKTGTTPVVSSLPIIETCLDKYSTYSYLTKRGIDTPKTWISPEDAINDEQYDFPFILKPRFGFGSINHLIVNNEEELVFGFKYIEARRNNQILDYLGVSRETPSTVIQELLSGDEYGIELLNNLNQVPVVQYQKRKLGMRAGETDGAEIIDDPRLADLGVKLSNELGHIGVLDCDIFFKDHKPYILEMNPRFGGQYPFSHLGGGNIPDLFVSNFTKLPNKLKIGSMFIKTITITQV